jgi:hypothetical protein
MNIADAINTVNDQQTTPEDMSTLSSYAIDYTKAMPVDAHVYGGAQTMVIPISKGFPIDPTDQARSLITKFRQENPYYASQNGGIATGFDTSIQNYG